MKLPQLFWTRRLPQTKRQYTPPPEQLPAQPLLDYANRQLRPDQRGRIGPLANYLHCSNEQIVRWLKGGLIEETTADRICCRLSMYPTEVWGDEWWARIDASVEQLDLFA